MEKVINIENSIDMRNVFGSNDENISIIEDAFSVRVILNDESVLIVGEDDGNCEDAGSVLEKLLQLSSKKVTMK